MKFLLVIIYYFKILKVRIQHIMKNSSYLIWRISVFISLRNCDCGAIILAFVYKSCQMRRHIENKLRNFFVITRFFVLRTRVHTQRCKLS